MTFPCTSCGACCRRIKIAVEQIATIMTTEPGDPLHFPYTWDEQGACEHLVDNRCAIYETRPLLCRVDDMAKQLNYTGKALKNYYKHNIDACNSMMDEDGIDEKFRIPNEKH